MNVLFISSGNRGGRISPIVQSQMASLIEMGLSVESYPVMGKGMIGYLRNVSRLRNYVTCRSSYNIFHAHYSLSAFVATMAGCRPLIVSLMGSDTKTGRISRTVIQLLSAFFWSRCIVKSGQMRKDSGLRYARVIPNGVNMDLFRPVSKFEAQERLGFASRKNHVLFGSDPDRPEKNYALAAAAVGRLNTNELEIHFLRNIEHEKVPLYLCACDVVLLTSKREGSPNVIKEAMACNCPIVSTDVGGVAWLFGSEPGHFLTTFDPEDVAAKIRAGLGFSQRDGRTRGRKRLLVLGLDSKNVAGRIIQVYQTALGHER